MNLVKIIITLFTAVLFVSCGENELANSFFNISFDRTFSSKPKNFTHALGREFTVALKNDR